MRFKYLWVMLIALFMPMFAYAAEDKPSAADKVADFAIEKLNDVISTTQAALPKVTDVALQVTWAGCLVIIVTGFIGLLIAAIALIPIVLGWKAGKDWYYNPDPPFFMFAIGLVVALVGSVVALVNLGDVWAWIGLWHPDLYLVHSLIEKVSK